MVQQRLLDFAIREFGLKGLEGASTRSIAAAARTAMSSITYHYGGKEGLYLAAADHIAERLSGEMAGALSRDEDLEPHDPARARAAIQAILAQFVDTMTGEGSADFALFIVREQMNPTEAFERLYAGMMGKMLKRIADLVTTATGRREADTAQIATVTLLGQVVSLRASRAAALKLLGRATIDDAVGAALKARIAANTHAILDQLIAERQELP